MGDSMRHCFRPLSWGLSFKSQRSIESWSYHNAVFVPFLGDFLSKRIFAPSNLTAVAVVFVPFLGDFLSKQGWRSLLQGGNCFRPLSWGLSFKEYWLYNKAWCRTQLFSSPFLGTFFQSQECVAVSVDNTTGFRPLSWGLSFKSVPAKPQPVCSCKRICGGDGGIASSGTLLRR